MLFQCNSTQFSSNFEKILRKFLIIFKSSIWVTLAGAISFKEAFINLMNNFTFSLVPNMELLNNLHGDIEMANSVEIYLQNKDNEKVRQKAIDILRNKLLDLGYLNAEAAEQPIDCKEKNIVVLTIIAPIREENKSYLTSLLSIFSQAEKFSIFS